MMYELPRFKAEGRFVFADGEGMVCACERGPDGQDEDEMAQLIARLLNGEPAHEPPPRIFPETPDDPKLADWQSEVEAQLG